MEMSFELIGGSFNTFFLIADFFRFWFFSGPLGLIKYFGSLNGAFLKLLSYNILLSTFFQPLKNEYREGLVGFSIAMGMVFKIFILFFETIAYLVLLVLEVFFVCAFVLWPFATLMLAFI